MGPIALIFRFPLLDRIVPPLPGSWIQCKQLRIPICGTILLPPTSGDENDGTLISSTWAVSLHSPLFSETSQKSSQSLLSPWFPSELCVYPDCDQGFLAQACNPVSNLQTVMAFCDMDTPCSYLVGGGEKGFPHPFAFCLLLGPYLENSHWIIDQFMIYSKSEQKANT